MKEPKITKARLLKVSELNAIPKDKRKVDRHDFTYWLEDQGIYPFLAKVAFNDGKFNSDGFLVDNEKDVYVRPVLEFSNKSDLKIGDKFKFGDKEFEIISEGIALCTSDIGKYLYRKNWQAPNANIYDKSDIKKFINDWFKKAR